MTRRITRRLIFPPPCDRLPSMIATAEVLDEPTHTTDPRLNFLADHLLSDLHAENVLRIFKTRLGGSPKISEFFSGTYESSLPPLAAISQEVADESALEIASGGIVFRYSGWRACLHVGCQRPDYGTKRSCRDFRPIRVRPSWARD